MTESNNFWHTQATDYDEQFDVRFTRFNCTTVSGAMCKCVASTVGQ